MLSMLLQINVADEAANVADAAGEAQELSLSLWDLALKGGWIMIPILLLSVIAVYIFFERLFAIQRAAKDDASFMNRIKENIAAGKVEDALSYCRQIDTPVSRMIEKGINRIGRPLNDINAAIENVGKLEVSKLEKNLATLATTSGAAPMIGFLGTVIGMIRAFYDMANAGANIDVGLLSNGIYTAMVTTVAGLIVGIVAYLAYNLLVARVEKVVNQLEARATEFMDLLYEPASN
ncbi:MAG: biopolymer transporter ExbB [Marinilabiliales bacterium]|nr:MAG: biopolymer transporter ExbB [Marinilabiliales bacterium]